MITGAQTILTHKPKSKNMKQLTNIFYSIIILLAITVSMTSCEAIAGIFKAGMWSGIIIVALIVGLILYFVSRSRK